MGKASSTLVLLSGVVLGLSATPAAHADEIPAEYLPAVHRGLEWLAGQQARDGHWEASGGQYQVAMTALAGMALLMEGSTAHSGKYSSHISKAVEWLATRSRANGLIGNADAAGQRERYMYGHGFALLFLSSVYGDEDDLEQRTKLEKILERAVQFSGRAQTGLGGWGYLAGGSYTEEDGKDEGSVTITQLQGIRAARNAGIRVPAVIIDKARDYLKNSTGQRGGVIYSLGMNRRDERLALTAAAVVCGFSSGDYESSSVKGWLRYCQNAWPGMTVGRRIGHDEYAHYYFAQVVYMLGDDRYAKLFPESAANERLTWSQYRKSTFDALAQQQNRDGSWNLNSAWSHIGPVYTTSMCLAILQLDKGALPIYQR